MGRRIQSRGEISFLGNIYLTTPKLFVVGIRLVVLVVILHRQKNYNKTTAIIIKYIKYNMNCVDDNKKQQN
jgi:hypothetical protein